MADFPLKMWCSQCGKSLSEDDVVGQWGEVCDDPPDHRHLLVGSTCYHAAIIDRFPEWVDATAKRLLSLVHA